MQGESGILHIRRRSAFEAADLGVAILRRFPMRIYLIVAPPLIICGVLVFFVCPWPWLSVFLLWWLKPVWDNLVVVPASHLLFNPQASIADLFHQLRLIRFPDLISDLTWRRFSPFRSYLLPVRLLEKLSGTVKSKRMKHLTARRSGSPILLTCVALALEIALFFSCMPLLTNLFPDLQPGFFLASESGQPAWGILVYLLCLLVIEPWYALAGFGLYLNSRTIIEGWDLALVFRGIGKAASRPLVCILVLFSWLVIGQPVYAQADDSAAHWRGLAKTVLANPDFGSDQEVPVWKPRVSRPPEPSATREPAKIQAKPSAFSEFLSSGLLIVVIIVGVLIVLALVASIVFNQRENSRAASGPRTIGPELRPIAPTGDKKNEQPEWSRQVDLLFNSGRVQAALALLYRIALQKVKDSGLIRIPDSATESDCVRLVRAQQGLDAGLASILVDIIQGRLRVVYALRSLPEAEFRQLHQRLLEWEEAVKN